MYADTFTQEFPLFVVICQVYLIVPRSPTVDPDAVKETFEYSRTFTLVGSETFERSDPFSKKSFVPFPSRSSISLSNLYVTLLTLPSDVYSVGSVPTLPSEGSSRSP